MRFKIAILFLLSLLLFNKAMAQLNQKWVVPIVHQPIVNGKMIGIITVFDFSKKELEFDSLIYSIPVDTGINTVRITTFSPMAYFGKNGKMYFINSHKNIADSNFKVVKNSHVVGDPNNDLINGKMVMFEKNREKVFYYFFTLSRGWTYPPQYDSVFYLKFKMNAEDNYPEIIQKRTFLALRKNHPETAQGFNTLSINVSMNGSHAWLIHLSDTNNINAFKFNYDSVFSIPVKNKLLWASTGPENIAPLRINNRGDKLYSIGLNSNQNSQFKVAEYPFDKSTGKLGTPRFMVPHFTIERDDSTQLTSATFSPNDSVLYITANYIRQPYSSRPSSIRRTRIISCNVYTKTVRIIKIFNTKTYIRNIATAPNGKIYYGIDTNYWKYDEKKMYFLFYEIKNPNRFSRILTEKHVHSTKDNYFFGNYDNYTGYGPLNVNTVGLFKGQCSDSFRFDFTIDTGYFKSARLFFGDGDSANIAWPFKSVTHKYRQAGMYGYELQCMPKNEGSVKYFTDSVEVANVSRLTYRNKQIQAFCDKSALKLNDSFLNTQVIQYYWGNGEDTTYYAFNQPKFIETYKDFKKTINKPEVFILNTRIANKYCDYQISDTFKLLFLKTPSQALIVNKSDICSGEEIRLSDTQNTVVKSHWFSGFNQSDSAKQVRFLNYSFYTQKQSKDSVFYIYTRTASAEGCFRYDSFEILVKGSPGFQLEVEDTSICSNSQLLKARIKKKIVPSSTAWTISDGTTIKNDTLFQKQYLPGKLNIKAKAITVEGCSDSTYEQIIVLKTPKADFWISDSIICEDKDNISLADRSVRGEGVINYWRYSLDSTRNLYGAGQSGIQYYNTGMYNIKLVVEDEANCKDSTYKKIVVLASPSMNWSITPSSLRSCLNNNLYTISEYGAGNNYVFWNTKIDSGKTISLSFDLPGKHPVRLVKSLGECSDTVDRFLEVLKNPIVSFSDTSACRNRDLRIRSKVILGDAPIQSYLWQTYLKPDQNNVDANYKFTRSGRDSLRITVTDTNNCKAHYTGFIHVTDTPGFVIIVKPETVYEGPLFGYDLSTIPASFKNYYWEMGDAGVSILQSPKAKFLKPEMPQLIRLKVATESGCETIKDTVIYPKGLTGYYFPNVFTPNGDGINDEFGIAGVEYIKSIKLRIYNKWGGKVFESNDPNEKWQGRNVLPGVYVFKAEIRDIYNRYKEVNGIVELAK